MNLRKMSKGTGGGADPFFAISGIYLDATRFNLPHEGGIVDDGDYDVLTEITSYQGGCVGRLGNLAGCILGWKPDLERAVNSSVKSNLWEKSPEDQENSFRQKTPPLTVEEMEYLHPNRGLKDIINITHEAIPLAVPPGGD